MLFRGRIYSLALGLFLSTLTACISSESETDATGAVTAEGAKPSPGATAREIAESCSVLPSDQKASLMAPLSSSVVIMIADERFSLAEIGEIQNAMNQWNWAGVQDSSRQFFELRQGAIPSGVRSGNPRDCSDALGTESSFYMVKETSQDAWKNLGFNSSIPGATIRCETQNRGKLQSQIMYLNPSLITSTQFESVVLHELGHAVGLDHSCNAQSGSAEFSACSNLSDAHPYKSAVMFPFLRGSTVDAQGRTVPETKEDLRDNDRSRLSCLY